MTKSVTAIATKGGQFDKPGGKGTYTITPGDKLVGKQAEAALANGWGKVDDGKAEG